MYLSFRWNIINIQKLANYETKINNKKYKNINVIKNEIFEYCMF